MHRSTVDAWVRFYDEVIVRGGDWAPEAWFPAVGDAMAEALPADSPILDTYRRRVDELLALEQASQGVEEERRISSLEAEIQRLIGAADEVIRTRRTVPATTRHGRELMGSSLRPRPARRKLRNALTAAAVLVLIGGGVLVALYLYDARLVLKVEEQLDRYGGDLVAKVARLDADLERQAADNRTAQGRLEELRGEVAADLEALDRKLEVSMAEMAGLADEAGRALERRLDAKSGAVVAMLRDVSERAKKLDQDLGEMDDDLGTLARDMPRLNERLNRLAEGADEGEAAVQEVMQQITALKTLAPEVERVAAKERESLVATVDVERQRLDELGSAIGELGAAFGEAGEELRSARTSISRELALSEGQRQQLEEALDEIDAASQRIERMRLATESELSTAEAVLRERTQALLDELAERADLAILRGDDVLARAEQNLAERAAAAGDTAMKSVVAMRQRELEGLSAKVAETRGELDRTRDQLVASWMRMGEEVARQQQALLDELDAHARSIEAKVAELTRSLDVASASAGASAR